MSDTYRVRRTARRSAPRSGRKTLGGRPKYSDEAILAAIRRWAERYGSPPTSADWDPARARRRGQHARVARFTDGSWPSTRMVRRAFGTFNAGVEAAGFVPIRAPSRIAPPLASPGEVLAAIQAWTSRYGEPPTMADWDPHRAKRLGQEWRIDRYRDGDWPSARTVCKHFGNLSSAIAAAGLRPRPQGARAAQQTAARREMMRFLRQRRAAELRAPTPQVLAASVSAVVNARKAGDVLILRGSLIQLAAVALNWADQVDAKS